MNAQQQRDAQLKRDRYAKDPAAKARDAARRSLRQKERYATDSEWRAQRIKAATENKRFSSRGITLEQYLSALKNVGYQCEGCFTPVSESTGFVDHDHETGLARGILCRGCNMAVNKHVSAETLRRLASYLDDCETKTRHLRVFGDQ